MKNFKWHTPYWLALAGLLAMPTQADTLLDFLNANRLDLFTSPGASTVRPPPNVIYLLDDSVSMEAQTLTPDANVRGLASIANQTYPFVLAVPDAHRAGAGLFAPSLEAVDAWNDGSHPEADGRLLHEDAAAIWRLRTVGYNSLYYDPSRTYAPWDGRDVNGSTFVNTDAVALWDPWLGKALGNTIDLTAGLAYSSSVPVAPDSDDTTDVALNLQCPAGAPSCDEADDLRYYPARYYLWDDSNNNGVVEVSENGGLVEIRAATATYPKASSRSDCVAETVCTYAEELRNFSTWFSYHRSRDWIVRGVIARMLAGQQEIRVGIETVHGDSALALDVDLLQLGTGGHRDDLLSRLFQYKGQQGGTPLRAGLDRVGDIFSCTGASCPYVTDLLGAACQSSYTVLISDGYDGQASCTATAGLADACIDLPEVASGGTVSNAPSANNYDGDNDTAFDGGAFADTVANTLADVAMNFYERDIVSTRDGIQQMLTYALHLDAPGSLDANPTDSAEPFDWPNPLHDSTDYLPAYNPDDMRHAAFNGRGGYVNALDVGEVARLTGALQRDASAVASGSGASGVGSSGALLADSLFYISSYNLASWTGDLQAFVVNDDGSLGERAWSASELLENKSAASRTILTFETAAREGIAFHPDSLQPSNVSTLIPAIATTNLNIVLDAVEDGLGPFQKLLCAFNLTGTGLPPELEELVCGDRTNLVRFPVGLDEDRINYLRGDRSREDDGSGSPTKTFRARDRVLGPLVNSRPILVGPPAFDYPDADYAAFRSTFASRKPLLYVGGNDGMLHGFDAETGEELLAYVPGRILGKVGKLADPDPQEYQRAWVDGQLSVVDAYGAFPACGSGTSCWRTVLVGGLRGGGQGWFALDVTDPTIFTEANANQIVLWEFADRPGMLLGSLENTLLVLIDQLATPAGVLSLGLPGVSTVSTYLDFLIPSNYSDFADPELGNTYGNTAILRLPNDAWAAVFGNGYNHTDIDLEVGENLQEFAALAFSLSGNSILMGVDLATGAKDLNLRVDTGVGEFIKVLDLTEAQLDKAETITFEGDELSTVITDVNDLLVNLLDVDIVDLITDPVAIANGMATPAAVDFDGSGQDSRVDVLYAGDLFGNLWRFDIDTTGLTPQFELFTASTGPSGVSILTANGKPLFNTTAYSNTLQSITTKPEVLRHQTGNGLMVYAGTGRYLETSDTLILANPPKQALYALWDQDEYVQESNGDADLLERSIVAEVSSVIDTDGDGTPDEEVEFRVTSTSDATDPDDDPVVDWTTHRGWALPLVPPGGTADGERIVNNLVTRNGRILAASLVVDAGVCIPGGHSWLYELSGADGDRLGRAPFDLDGNGFFDKDDTVEISTGDAGGGTEQVVVSGRQSTVGITGVPAIMITRDRQELHISPGSSGELEVIRGNPSGPERTRSTWREIR